ncbi:RNA-directed DNA polymerase, eukaryota, reverse transcriptase zinc-binding domain protein [Tanacetum coccineum]|uniref:RNA-directed DNA polymerase, eukaryota, reverse transcriptase zinc-binding domain protein n=1 Tax=Tanacetum coccineum TaxID=301880 RepID=A0ABQ5FNH4_9ASTR
MYEYFGSWIWQTKLMSRIGFRIAVGWDASNVKCSHVHTSCQSMLCLVEVLSSQQTFFYTFIYDANKGRDRKELWKDLNLYKRIMGDSTWAIMGDVNLKGLKPFLNKLNWKNGNLFDKVVDLKNKLHNVQERIDLNPSDKSLRTEGIEVLKEYKLNEEDSCLFEKRVCDEEAILMTREVTDDEIKKSLYDIDDYKAQGRDDFTSKFYKKAWNTIDKRDLCDWEAFGAINDKILLTQEPLKGYNCVHGPKRCSFKIDIQKAYDTLNWLFIEEIMIRFGFPSKMVSWIMTCIANPKFTICVNGERYGYFRCGRGLRQGDPISPYIFTIIIEILNFIVKDEIRKESSFKYLFGCKQLKITHLCFADDLIMLCHGGTKSVQTIKKALDKFSAVLGLYPNLGKCTMFYDSLDDETKKDISSYEIVGKAAKEGPKWPASKKELLSIKWINVVKLKNMSVWDVAVDPKDSWGGNVFSILKNWWEVI